MATIPPRVPPTIAPVDAWLLGVWDDVDEVEVDKALLELEVALATNVELKMRARPALT